MFKRLLKWFGFSDNDDKTFSRKDWDEEVKKSLENAMNRTVHKTLTAEIIDAATDDELSGIVVDNLFEKLKLLGDESREHENVLTFSIARQAIYIIRDLDVEVSNCGFKDYYLEPCGQLAKLAPGALRLVKANKLANLTEKANRIYEVETLKTKTHQDGSLDGFSESYNDALSELDDEYERLSELENLEQLLADFIRKNKTEFID